METVVSGPSRRWRWWLLPLCLGVLLLIGGAIWWARQQSTERALQESLVQVDRCLDRDFPAAEAELERASKLARRSNNEDWQALVQHYGELLEGLRRSNGDLPRGQLIEHSLSAYAPPEATALLRVAQLRWAKWIAPNSSVLWRAIDDLEPLLDQDLDPSVLERVRTQWLTHKYVFHLSGYQDAPEDAHHRRWLEQEISPELEYLALLLSAWSHPRDQQWKRDPAVFEALALAKLDGNLAVAAMIEGELTLEFARRNLLPVARGHLLQELELCRKLQNPSVQRVLFSAIAPLANDLLQDPRLAQQILLEVKQDPGYAEASDHLKRGIELSLRDLRAQTQGEPDDWNLVPGPTVETSSSDNGIDEMALRRQREASQLREKLAGEQRRSIYLSLLSLGVLLPLTLWLVRTRIGFHRSRVALDRQQEISADSAREVEKLNSKLARLQRMESLGLMAGSIAHDFNNILVGISGNAELMDLAYESGTCSESFARERIAAIKQSSQRAGKLAKQMLDYAGKRYVEQRVQDLNRLLTSNRSVLESFSQKEHRIELLLADEPLLSCVDETQIEQVFFNLVTNAMQSSPPGTSIQIRSSRVHLSPDATHDCFGSRSEGGEFCSIAVQDQGVGIPSSTLDRIFEPYFSTSQHGRGLGLAVVYGIMESHGGLIRCHSEVGQGTTFEILFPAVEADAPLAQPQSRTGVMPAEGSLQGLQVLVIDDEASVLETCQQLLEHGGIHATTANGGESGLEALLEAEDRFDCVLMDVVMPDLSASQILDELEHRGIQVPVVLMSGFSADRLDRFQSRHNVVRVLPKPFGIEQLHQAIARAAQEHPGGRRSPQAPASPSPHEPQSLPGPGEN